MNLRSLTVALSLASLLPASASAERSLQQVDAVGAVDVAQASNAFAIDLLKHQSSKPGNTFVSPYSISAALSMTWAGAAGTTKAQMAKVLHLLPSARQHQGMKALRDGLADRGDDKVTIAVANKLWGQRGFKLLPSFLKTVKDHYGAGLQQVDFGLAEKQRLAINGWVQANTANLIDNLLQPGDVTPATKLVLTNAIVFKGIWKYAFDKRKTSDAGFWVGGKTNKNVPTMHRKFAGGDDVGYAKRKDHQVLELPYGNGSTVMTILLPDDKAGLPAMVRTLTPASFASPPRTKDDELHVALPRITMTYRASLKKTLSAMGMPAAFAGADFSAMSPGGGLAVADVIHKAFVSVDEAGTKAAAATAVMMDESMPSVTRFVADRPFVFAIRDTASGAILFMGQVHDPAAK